MIWSFGLDMFLLVLTLCWSSDLVLRIVLRSWSSVLVFRDVLRSWSSVLVSRDLPRSWSLNYRLIWAAIYIMNVLFFCVYNLLLQLSCIGFVRLFLLLPIKKSLSVVRSDLARLVCSFLFLATCATKTTCAHYDNTHQERN